MVTGGETKEEQGLTREEMIEQERLRKEALLQVMFLIFDVCCNSLIRSRKRDTRNTGSRTRSGRW